MSANLKKNGHQCHIIFLKRFENRVTNNLKFDEDESPWLGIDINGKVIRFAENSPPTEIELELLHKLISRIEPELIGMTVTTPTRRHAIHVTRFLKKYFDLPIVWGGFDPTVQTSICLEYADYVCIGEGDRTIIEIAEHIDNGCSIKDVCNLVL